MLATIQSAALNGLNAFPVTIEVNSHDASEGGARFTIVGLPDSAVKESSERVQAAVRENGFQYQMRSTVVNLSPADMRKEGSGFDLPIAIAFLLSLGHVQADQIDLQRYMFVGELGLGGQVLPVRGALPIAIKARELKYEALIVPEENAREAAVVNNLKVYGVKHLQDVIGLLQGTSALLPTVVNTREEFYASQQAFPYDFSEVKGQENVKRAFEVAAAGGHNIILIGSPGCGKSMMAKRLPSILPPLSLQESLETTQIHSIAGQLNRDSTLISQRPFRTPHHTVSDVGLAGGTRQARPGEVSLAHNGVLFLDELTEFNRAALEILRQPLEDRKITITRAQYSVEYPCSFMLVASMNPCPCGYYGDPLHKCVCTPGQISRYLSKISGPLLDRIDIHIEMQAVPFSELSQMQPGEPSANIRERVIRARKIQEIRFKDFKGIHCNAQMTERMIHQYAEPDASSMEMLRMAMERLSLSARAYSRILKVSRTIADLDGSECVQSSHIAEAIGYRNLDRGDWAERGI